MVRVQSQRCRPYQRVMQSIMDHVHCNKSRVNPLVYFEYFEILYKGPTEYPDIRLTEAVKGTFLEKLLPPIEKITLLHLALNLTKFAKLNSEENDPFSAQSKFISALFKPVLPYSLEETFIQDQFDQEDKIYEELYHYNLENTFFVNTFEMHNNEAYQLADTFIAQSFQRADQISLFRARAIFAAKTLKRKIERRHAISLGRSVFRRLKLNSRETFGNSILNIQSSLFHLHIITVQ